MAMTDDELVYGIRRKDESALDALVHQYGGLIKSVVSYHISEIYRDECINDILFSIWNNISKFNPEKNSLKNWIGAVCKYKCIDYKRKYYKEKISEMDENIPSSYTAEQSILMQETEKEIDELLSYLRPTDREIFRRRYIENETVDEISNQMHIESSVLYNRLSRGRRRLKKSLLRSSDHDEK